MAKKKVPAAEAAKEIQRLCDEGGMTHAQIKEQRPELSEGWGYNVTKTAATRPSRGGGAMGGPSRPVAVRP